MADVPRVIQAMEWSGTMMMAGSGSDSLFDYELAQELGMDGYELDRDPVELLGGFSLALATATSSGQLSRTVERDLAFDEDRWAVAQLLHGDHRFGATVPPRHVPLRRDRGARARERDPDRRAGNELRADRRRRRRGADDLDRPEAADPRRARAERGGGDARALRPRARRTPRSGCSRGWTTRSAILNDHLRIDDSSRASSRTCTRTGSNGRTRAARASARRS